MAGKKTLRVLLTAVLILSMTILPSFTFTAGAEKTITDWQDEKAQLDKQEKEQQANIDRLKNDISNQQQYKAAIDAQVITVEKQIDSANGRIAALDADITQKESEIAGKEQDIKGTLEKFKQRLRVVYMMGDFNTLDIVLNAQDINDFIDRSELMQSFNDRDTAMLNKLRTDKDSIAAQKEVIEQNRTEVANEKKGLDDKNAQLTSLQNESQRVLNKMNTDKKNAESYRQQILAKEAEADKQIQTLIDQLTSKGSYVGGKFAWPVPGYGLITSPFGDTDGRSSGHKGMDIAGSGIYGKPIVAANSGTVYVASWVGGYGNCVMIDHGGGLVTVYGHCSSLLVSKGQQVQKGQIIAKVGSTGDSTGPHLHFEVDLNKKPVNPASYLY